MTTDKKDECIVELETELARLRLQIETDTEATARLYEGYEAQEAELTALRAQDARLRDVTRVGPIALAAVYHKSDNLVEAISIINAYRAAVLGEEGGEGE